MRAYGSVLPEQALGLVQNCMPGTAQQTLPPPKALQSACDAQGRNRPLPALPPVLMPPPDAPPEALPPTDWPAADASLPPSAPPTLTLSPALPDGSAPLAPLPPEPPMESEPLSPPLPPVAESSSPPQAPSARPTSRQPPTIDNRRVPLWLGRSITLLVAACPPLYEPTCCSGRSAIF